MVYGGKIRALPAAGKIGAPHFRLENKRHQGTNRKAAGIGMLHDEPGSEAYDFQFACMHLDNTKIRQEVPLCGG